MKKVQVKKDKVRYVSKLCKIDIEDNIDKYYEEFTAIMESVNKILDAEVDKDILIVPNQNTNRFYEGIHTDKVNKIFAKVENGYHVFRRWKND